MDADDTGYDGIPSYPFGPVRYDGNIREILLGKFGVTRKTTMHRTTINLIVTTLRKTLLPPSGMGESYGRPKCQ
jgi:hypothetical protein